MKKKAVALFLVMVVTLSMLLVGTLPSPALAQQTSGSADMVVYYPGSTNGSYFDTTLDGGSELAGWCVDRFVYIVPGRTYGVTIWEYYQMKADGELDDLREYRRDHRQ